MKRYYTVKDTARILSMSEFTVRKLVRTGDLPHVRIGRNIRIDLEAVTGKEEEDEPKTA